MQENPSQKKNAQLSLLLQHQRELYEDNIRRLKRTSIIIMFVLTIFLGAQSALLIYNNQKHKETIEKLNKQYASEKKKIIDTAFYIKDNLIGEYYVDDKKRFEDFMLSGSRFVTQAYYLNRTNKKHQMNNKQLKKYLETTYIGANLVGIDPYLLLSIDYIESGFDTKAKSPVGALGICQFMPLTAKLLANARTNYTFLQVDGYDIKKLFDPVYSKKLQVRFVKYLFDEYDGRVQWVLLAYNHGPGKTMAKWWNNGSALFKDLPPEQRQYAEKVLDIYNKIKTGYHITKRESANESGGKEKTGRN